MRLAPIAQFIEDASISDVARTLSYRSEIFGRPFSEMLQELLRGPSEWSVGERELFASFTSHLNRCRY